MRLNSGLPNVANNFYSKKNLADVTLPSYFIYKLAERHGLTLFETFREPLPGRNWPVRIDCSAKLTTILNEIHPTSNKCFLNYGASLLYVLSEHGEIIAEERRFGQEETNHNALANKVYMAGDIYIERSNDKKFLGTLVVNNKSGSFYPHQPMNFIFCCLILLKFGLIKYANLHNFKLRFDFLSINQENATMIKEYQLGGLANLTPEEIDTYIVGLPCHLFSCLNT